MIEELGTNLIPVLAISLTFMFFAIWVVAATIDSIYKTRCNFYLKQKLIERGASANEIREVIKAGQETYGEEVTPVPPVKAGNVMPMSQ